MSKIKDFSDPSGKVYAHAAIPDGYLIGASYTEGFQHESVPLLVTAHAINTEKNIMIFGLTDEKFTTYRNQMIKMTLKYMLDVKWNSIRDFIEPEDYLQQFAEALSQMKLTPVGEAHLPSVCGQNEQQSYNDFLAQYQESFQRDAQFGTTTNAGNILVKSFMRRYEGVAASGAKCSVIAGMDYNGIEYHSYAPGAEMFSGMSMLGNLFSGKKKENQDNTKFGHGSPVDGIDWGAKNKFLMVSPKEFEQEAFEAFMEFVQTFHMDNAVRNRFYELLGQRTMMRIQETMKFQGMAQANMQSLRMNQQRLQQTLAQNSADMSNMIMDSWNKKMASDSRISQARSEAIRGVNTYTNTYGQNVEVSVAADHVYQNRYGDVYGVSGPELDQTTLNGLSWTKLDK